MDNHFGKGLMAGLKAEYTKPATEIAKFCSDYKRGFVLGYAYHLAESTGDENQAAYQAGLLCREYGLDKALINERILFRWRESAYCKIFQRRL